MHFKTTLKLFSLFLLILATLLAIPTIYAHLISSQHGYILTAVTFIPSFIGMSLLMITRTVKYNLNIKTTFAFVTLCWLSFGFIGALPYYMTNSLIDFSSSFFEAISGVTGTGATVFTDVEAVPKELLLWRSLTQWVGGIGIVVFFVALLPLLGISGGYKVIKAENVNLTGEQITTSVKESARLIFLFYVVMTTLLTVILSYLGMSSFDALNHALTCMATGGFSTKNKGIAHFDSLAIEVTITVFMLIAATSFLLYFILLRGKWKEFLQRSELKAFLTIIVISVFWLTINLYFHHYSFTDSLTQASFTVVSMVTSTGYTNYDYTEYSHFALVIIIFLMIMGGMSGSTAGGMKCFRILSCFKLVIKELKQALHPNAIVPIKINKQILQDKAYSSIWGFVFIYFFTLITVLLIISSEKLDFLSSVSVTISALSNIGPAFGDFGPFDNYSSLTALGKYTLSAAMLLGRLEFFAILVLFTNGYWRKY